jgi:hypothetical protein
MITDDNLLALSMRVDSKLINWCEEHEIDPLSMSSIVLARLTLFLDTLGAGEDYRKILQVAIDTRSKQAYNSDMITKH